VTDYTVGATLDGDFNFDGRVDSADYTLWRNRGGAHAEYLLWKANFGRTLAGSAAISAPEPQSCALVVLAILSSTFVVRMRSGRNVP
jgi:hypothetical protein